MSGTDRSREAAAWQRHDAVGEASPGPVAPATTAAPDLFVAVYDELRDLAAQWFGRQPGNHTLQPTALVHEAFVRLARDDGTWRSRTHFFAAAATAMRQILVDHARRRLAAKRGRSWHRLQLDDLREHAAPLTVNITDLCEALDELDRLNHRQRQIVELRFLTGLSVAETARVMGVSPRTVKLDWRMARAWLLARLQHE
jgi:RNA polymerase sigma factor (TIGR02999 family)